MLIACALLAGLVLPTAANDSTATMGAGGITYTTSSQIRIQREDLYISEQEVRVAYDFLNEGEKDITTLVAFPLPDLDFDGDWNYAIEATDPVNWIGFSVTVDGQDVKPDVQARATRNGVDVTPVLEKYGIPVTLLAGPDELEKLDARLDQLPQEAKDELLRYGVIDWTSQWGAGMKPIPTMHWTSQITFHWFQTFPAGRTIHVEHRYKPVAGYSFVSQYGLDDGTYQRTFCMDDAQAKALSKRLKTERYESMSGIELQYVLVTARNWLGMIGNFTMTIDKGDADTLLATCWKGLKPEGPQKLTFTEENFQPEGDLSVLLIRPLSGDE